MKEGSDEGSEEHKGERKGRVHKTESEGNKESKEGVRKGENTFQFQLGLGDKMRATSY